MTEFLSAEQILTNARAIAPEITSRAAEAAALRRLPRDLVDKLKAAGCFRVMFPRSWGGPEMSLPMQVELAEILAYADTAGSTRVQRASCIRISTSRRRDKRHPTAAR